MRILARKYGGLVSLPVDDVRLAIFVLQPVVNVLAAGFAALFSSVLHPSQVGDRVVRIQVKPARLADARDPDRHIFFLESKPNLWSNFAMKQLVVIMRRSRARCQHFLATGCQ